MILLQTDRHTYLFDAESAALARLSPAARDACLGATQDAEASRQVLRFLQQSRPEPPAEPPTVRSLALNVSQSCNLACRYCYADKAPGRQMSFETARAALQFLQDQGAGPVSVSFFGGEPLLNFTLIRATVEHAREIGLPATFSLTTNATLVSEEIADYLGERRIGVTVSLDGPPELQDRNRPFLSGKGSSRALEARVGLLLARVKSRPVGARVTLVRGSGRARPIFDYLSVLGFQEVGFSPVSHPELHLSDRECDELLEDFAQLARDYREAACRRGYLGFSNLSNLLAEIAAGQPRSYACGAGQGLLGVDWQGDFYLCHRFAGQEGFRFGDVHSGVTRRLPVELRVEQRGPECRRCWMRHLCAGGCYYEAHVRTGDFRHPTLHFCTFLRRWTRLGLETYAHLLEEAPDFLERLRGRQRWKSM